MIELTPVSLKHIYVLEGPQSGYEFTVYCSKDDEYNSWSASVTITDWGFKTSEAAVEGLVPALRNLYLKITGEQPKPFVPNLPPEEG